MSSLVGPATVINVVKQNSIIVINYRVDPAVMLQAESITNYVHDKQ